MQYFQSFRFSCTGFVNPVAAFLVIITVAACSSQSKSKSTLFTDASKSSRTDYSNIDNWAAHPYKKDFSDSTPKPYQGFTVDSTVDVFFIHPTSYTVSEAVNPNLLSDTSQWKLWNASVTDTALNTKTDKGAILLQASAFNRYRVFAPRYRQAHLQAFFIPDSLARPFFDTAYTDIKEAFRYYLEHYNQGRPFIIASHSQGTMHAGHLIKDTVENTPLLQQMVVAYLIGMPVPPDYFTHCQPCKNATQTGCFVSWRTFKQEAVLPDFVAKEKYKAVVVNPLTWTMDTTLASSELNKGAVLFKFNNPLPNAVSAQIHGSVLWSSKPHFKGSLFFTRTNYHIGDINLFWVNIRENVTDRVKAWGKRRDSTKANF